MFCNPLNVIGKKALASSKAEVMRCVIITVDTFFIPTIHNIELQIWAQFIKHACFHIICIEKEEKWNYEGTQSSDQERFRIFSAVLLNTKNYLKKSTWEKPSLFSKTNKTHLNPQGQHPELYYQNLPATNSQKQPMLLILHTKPNFICLEGIVSCVWPMPFVVLWRYLRNKKEGKSKPLSCKTNA